MIKIKRALISVSDKAGIVELAKTLDNLGVEILSTGGTAALLKKNGIAAIEVADYTGFPEMLDGRVKTLHPKIHGGLLARRDLKTHQSQAKKHDIGMIDMVVVNLYPFEKTIAKKSTKLHEAIEQIDIGGPSMLRSAAKNHNGVVVVCNPTWYDQLITEMTATRGCVSEETSAKLALEVFRRTSSYDQAIAQYLAKHYDDSKGLPNEMSFSYQQVQSLRYGENPHQQAAFYKDSHQSVGMANLKQLHGKELSYNNILDLNAAIDVVREFKLPAAVIIKHNNPTGVAQDKELVKAYKQAHSCDTLSAFGGIIGLNKKVDEKTAKAISTSGFMECIIAPAFSKEAKAVLTKKKNVRLIQVKLNDFTKGQLDLKRVHGGLLVQEKDEKSVTEKQLTIVSKKKPTKAQLESMLFGWKVVKHVKSNAICLTKGNKTVGMGVGQTSRVDSAKIAINKSGKDAKGACLISDAFLPKEDTVTIAAKAGIKAIIQTGGSIMDKEVIKEADRLGIVMVTTGARHFKH